MGAGAGGDFGMGGGSMDPELEMVIAIFSSFNLAGNPYIFGRRKGKSQKERGRRGTKK